MCTLFLLLPLILCIVFASYAYARRGTQGSWPDICMQRTKLIITPSHHPRKTAFSWPKSTTRSFAHSHSHTRTRTQAQALALHVLHTPTFKEQSWHSVPLFPGLPLSTTRSRSRSFSPSWHLPGVGYVAGKVRSLTAAGWPTSTQTMNTQKNNWITSLYIVIYICLTTCSVASWNISLFPFGGLVKKVRC